MRNKSNVIRLVEKVDNKDRGNNGFGSTGI